MAQKRQFFQFFKVLCLYARTLSYLKIKQLLYLLYHSLRFRNARFLLPKLSQNLPEFTWTPIKSRGNFLTYPWFNAHEIAQGRFCFLNDTIDFGDRIQWGGNVRSRLWKYNLHYFQFLHPYGGLDRDVASCLMKDWIMNNPPGTPDAWDPFPISLRIVNWIKYITATGMSNADLELICRSAYLQTSWLEQTLEKHLGCNHLFKNAKALIFAGLSFQGCESKRWLRKGVDILNEELIEQILPDGGHFERSPMYHSMILEDCLDLLNVGWNHGHEDIRALSGKLLPVIQKMVYFLNGMTHPDKQIALFNDSALGIESSPTALISYYEMLTGEKVSDSVPPIWSFPDTGYFVMAPRAGDRLIIDCGRVGPEYQPGHAHCDTLSIELSLNYTRVIVDSGCFSYEDEMMRKYNRGNAGHNALTLDKKDQSELWATFRCARRARPLKSRMWQDDNALYFEGSHDGYRRLQGRPVHKRRIQWTGKLLRIEDEIFGRGKHDLELRLHINPACEVTRQGAEVHIRDKEKNMIKVQPVGDLEIGVHQGWYCPSFGKQEVCPVITLKGHREIPFKTGWLFLLV